MGLSGHRHQGAHLPFYAGPVPTTEDLTLACADLDGTVEHFVSRLGYRLDVIWPADDPSVAVLSRGSDVLRLVLGSVPAVASPGRPGTPVALPAGVPGYELTHAADTDSGVGRAGMHYRDLLPSRQDGRFIASHIRIPEGGPVPDYAHHHLVHFQLIYCAAGWVRVVYEDQGEPFVLRAGDCVLQPPGIRHQVLEASPGLEVVEVGCPAEHPTFAEHVIALPTAVGSPERRWDGQRFVHHRADAAVWRPWRAAGFECRDTGIGAATDGLAGVRVVRPVSGVHGVEFPPYDGEFLFWYVLSGTATLSVGGRTPALLRAGSAVSLAAAEEYRLSAVGPDLEILEVMLPG